MFGSEFVNVNDVVNVVWVTEISCNVMRLMCVPRNDFPACLVNSGGGIIYFVCLFHVKE